MKKYRVFFVSYSFNKGGAAIAANKFRLLAKNELGFSTIALSQANASKRFLLIRCISFLLSKLQFDNNSIKHSLNLFSYRPVLNSLNNNSSFVYHFHWINNDTISIFKFDKIPLGSIISLHDEWLYCGSEHYYKVLDNSNDFINGYRIFKKGVYGFHWNYFIWLMKKIKLSNRDDLIFTIPSKWMLSRAKSSLILKGLDVRYLPNPIDTDIFKPIVQTEIEKFKEFYQIKKTDIVICFGAINGKSNYLKGAHLLDQALDILAKELAPCVKKNIYLVDFGGSVDKCEFKGFCSLSLGHISDPNFLAVIYSSVDCVVVPSMVESFGQIAAESLSCETPVVCFDTSGLKDIVLHEQTGFVADSFNPQSLANMLKKAISMSVSERVLMGKKGRLHVQENFAFSVVAKQYEKIIKDSIEIKRSNII